ncbi:MAG: PTS fructose transporter subunit IIA [Gammaproteobacteria bacterium]|nr:PTS fructose transporter subunit IIA [Gammaproteobacteria bacterium]
MSIGLLIITHNNTGRELLNTATKMFGRCPLEVKTIEVRNESDPDQLKAEATRLTEQLNSGDGVLVLADMYGSTPGNIASAICEEDRINVLAGINLPMLARIFNYSQLNLTEITEAALTGGQKGIIQCSPSNHD